MNIRHEIVDLEKFMKRNTNTIQVNEISEATKASFRTRVITAIIGLCVVIPILILGDWPFLALIVAALCIGVCELITCAKKKYSRWLYLATFVFCLCLTLWPWLKSSVNNDVIWDIGHIYSAFNSLNVSFLVLIVSFFALFYLIMWDENFTVRDACFIFALGFFISMGFQSLLFLRFFPLMGYKTPSDQGFYNLTNTFGSMWLIIFLLIGTFMTDTGAYAFGILFGHKKVNPRISPNKTWGGFFGGLFTSAVFSGAFGLIMAATGNPILPAFDATHGSVFDLNHWYNIVLLALIIPPVATLGDFVFSAIKRFFGIKDFGKLLPGHGGILDRVDSLLFAALAMAIFVYIAYCLVYGTNGYIL